MNFPAPIRWPALIAVALLLVLVPARAAGAQYGGTSGLVIDPPVILADGDEVDIIGSGCNDGEEVTVHVPALGVDVAQGIATGENGDFSIQEITITATPGIYPVEARCGELILVAEVTVVDSEAERAARQAIIEQERLEGALAFTGSERTTILVKVATGILALGCLFALLGWRRRGESATAR